MKTAYVVMGMHRSGTSAVAGSLAMTGVTAPTSLMPPKPDNPLGFWESERIVDFNEEILRAAGSGWDDWAPLDQSVFEGEFKDHFQSAPGWILHMEFDQAETIVIKDPRLCRCFAYWREHLTKAGFRPVVISPIRAPDEVARSLAARNGMARSKAMRLWLRHVLEAEHASRGQPRHIATLDDLADDWRTRFERITRDLDVSLDWEAKQTARAIDKFWSRPNDPSDEAASERDPHDWPPLVRRAWAAFVDISERGESPEALRALDKVRSELNASMALFYDGPGAA